MLVGNKYFVTNIFLGLALGVLVGFETKYVGW